jgi:hypothetical protein
VWWVAVALAAEPAPDAPRDRGAHPDLRVRRRAEQPPYPRLPAGEVPPFEVACLVRVSIGTDGRPYRQVADDPCPEPFAATARAALAEWRWKPYRVDGARVQVQTTVKYVFRPDEGSVPPPSAATLAEAREIGRAHV